MEMPVAGDIYRHFKGDLVSVVAIATHTETNEYMVVYYHNNKLWVRPISMFVSKVDKTKYPNCKYEYRFTKVEK